MAEFCSQCSIELFVEDLGELAGLCDPGYCVAVLCEDCGIIYVDDLGRCISDCPKRQPEHAPITTNRQSRARALEKP